MTQQKILVLKIDVDTERGTRIGVPNLVHLLQELNITATFLFALGPDNTGRALKRIFRSGFYQKVSRTNVISTYGIRTLLNGILWPGPHIGKRHAGIMRRVHDAGFEIGIHCYDHVRWQDGVAKMTTEQIRAEFQRAVTEFKRIFELAPQAAGAPGWQANAKTLAVYDEFNLLYGSDCRGKFPFMPCVAEQQFNTLQIPTTLPTLDELIGHPQYPMEKLSAYYLSQLSDELPNVMTCHAELEGMRYLSWFQEFLITMQQHDIQFKTLATVARDSLQQQDQIPKCEIIQSEIAGRSGKMAVQKIEA
jgi:peptidoglycan/xylan/chitin deacetylase (PgdA/CDA1 family)